MATRLVIEWTRLTLRLAVAEGSGSRLRVRAIHSQPNLAPEAAVETLRTMLKTARIGSASVIGVVSREQVITRVVKFPAIEPVELAQMVELYAKAQLPYPWEETVMDFHVVSRQGGFSTVAVVACQREVIDRYLTIFRGAALSVELLTLSPWGVLGWYRHAVKPSAAQEPCLVVHVDDARTDLVLVAGGRILSSRSIGQGVVDWEAMGDATELLTLEVERSRAAIRKELPEAEVRAVILTGLGATAQWSGSLAQRLNLPVTAVESRQAFKGCVIPTTSVVSPVVVGGIAASPVQHLLNISPTQMRVQVRHRQQVRELSIAGMLLLGVLGLGSSGLSVHVIRQGRLTKRLEQALARLQPAAKQAQDKTRSSHLVSSVIEDRRQLAQVLADVFASTPEVVHLETVTFERAKRELLLRGSAASDQDMLAYRTKLEQLAGVGSVQLKYSTRRSTPSGDRTDFEMVLRQGIAS